MRSPATWVMLGGVATTLIAIMQVRGLRFWENPPHAVFAFGMGWVLWIYIARELILRKRRLMTAVILLLLPLSWTIAWDRCPHATYLAVGPNLIAVPIGGRACGNSRCYRVIWQHLLDRGGVANW